MRISTLNTSLQLTLKSEPSKDKNKDTNPDTNGDGSDGQGKEDDQDGGDTGSGDSDSDQDGQGQDGSDGEKKGDSQEGTEKGASNEPKGEADKSDIQDEGYGDNSGGKGVHQGGGDASDDFTDVAQQLSDAINQGLFGTTDRDDALNESLEQEVQESDPLQRGEARYNPMQRMYPKELSHTERDTLSANKVLKEIAKESGQVKVGLQRLIRAMEQTNVSHGTRDGRLSSRMYAKTWGELKGGKAPSRPYYKRSEKMDISIACSVVVDQSSSMSGLKRQTVKGMLALGDALNSVGAATQVTGYRYGGYDNPNHFHGVMTTPVNGSGACIDIFQQFGEKFTAVKGRFAHLRATGGTPTADGMQYALEGLSERNEAFRIMFVLTDGCADGGHQPIINRQIRLAKEAGIHVVGVGLGRGTQGVVSSYPDHIVAEDMSQLPEALIAKLKVILKPSANKRGRRVAS